MTAGLVFDITVTVNGEDVSAFVPAGATVDYGRASTAEGFGAPQAVFDVLTPYGWSTYIGDPTDFPQLDVGDEVLIHVTWNGTEQHRRFTGKVQALDWNPMWYTVTAAGNSVDLDTKIVGDTQTGSPFLGVTWIPAEQDIPSTGPTLPGRVARFAADAELTINILGTEGRWLNGIAPQTPGVSLLEAVLDIASDCDGLFRETRLGDLDYVARIHDRPVRYLIPATVVEHNTLEMTIERGLIRNAVAVEYGSVDELTGNRPRAYATNPTSIAEIGERSGDAITTQLRYKVGAQGKGARWLTNNGKIWTANDVTLVMALCTGEDADYILALGEGDPVRLGPLPPAAPMTYYDADILGFTEVLHQTDYRIALHLTPGFPAAGEDDGNWVTDGSLVGGDATGTYVRAGREWRWHAWTTPGEHDLEVTAPVTARGLVGGGGGDGGAGTSNGALVFGGGGGGSGAIYETDAVHLDVGTISVHVGDRQQYSQLLDIRAHGGGDGGAAAAGEDGGSGGGAGGVWSSTRPGGAATGGSLDGGVTTTLAGFSAADGHASTASPGAGGGAAHVSDITGPTITYGLGGLGGGGPVDGAGPCDGGAGGIPGAGSPGGLGAPGTVIIAYRISPGTSGFPYDTSDYAYDSALTYDQGI